MKLLQIKTNKGITKHFTNADDLYSYASTLPVIEIDFDSIKEVNVKASASIEFDTYTNEDNERSLTAYITVKSELAEIVFMALANKMNGEEFIGCPVDEEGLYTDGIVYEYEHGNMSSIKEDIKYLFKMAKKELGIR